MICSPKDEVLREPKLGDAIIASERRVGFMLVERGMKVLNVAVVGDAYSIASNYLRKSGEIADSLVTNDRLLELIVTMFHRGEQNKLKLANRAIAEYQAVVRH